MDLTSSRALLVRLSEQAYRDMTALDPRALTEKTEGIWIPLQEIINKSEQIIDVRPPHFIFHIGHCGSALISRLLGEFPDCFALREPLTLFQLTYARRALDLPISRVSDECWQRLLRLTLKLLGRTYRPGTIPIAKPSSVCANLIAPVMNTNPQSRSMFLYVSLETYLATMLRREPSRDNMRDFAPAWFGDLHKLDGLRSKRLYELSDAQQAVLAWLGPMVFFAKATAMYPKRTRWMNFDKFLKEPTEQLKDICDFFQLANDHRRVSKLVESELMNRYSKNLSVSFNASTRSAKLEISRQKFAREIRAGIEWGCDLIDKNEDLAGLKSYV